MLFAVAILSIGAFGLYVLTPEERRRLLATAAASGGRLGSWLLEGRDERQPFLDALRTRTKWPLVTAALVGGNVLVFAMMVSAAAPAANADALLHAGASFGPKTSNGEWWRLVSAVFVHGGWLLLLFDVAVITTLGVLLERLLGPLTFALVFVAGGVLSNCVYLASHPLGMRTGSWGAIYALMGLLAVWSVRSLRTRSDVTIPRSVFRGVGLVVALFTVVSVAGDWAGFPANLAAFIFGTIAGLVLMGGITEGTPAPARTALVAVLALTVAAATAMPSRGIADVRPEIARVLAMESQTAATYDTTLARFKRGATTRDALAQTIDRRILPPLRDAQARLAALRGVPAEHRPLVADAEEYVRLRTESWQLRARALHTSNMRELRLADDRERASLDALDRLKALEPR